MKKIILTLIFTLALYSTSFGYTNFNFSMRMNDSWCNSGIYYYTIPQIYFVPYYIYDVPYNYYYRRYYRHNYHRKYYRHHDHRRYYRHHDHRRYYNENCR